MKTNREIMDEINKEINEIKEDFPLPSIEPIAPTTKPITSTFKKEPKKISIVDHTVYPSYPNSPTYPNHNWSDWVDILKTHSEEDPLELKDFVDCIQNKKPVYDSKLQKIVVPTQFVLSGRHYTITFQEGDHTYTMYDGEEIDNRFYSVTINAPKDKL